MRPAITVLHFPAMDRVGRILSHPVVVSGLVALILTGGLYGDALTLPLFSDDLVQIPWLETVSWSDLWTSASPYGYYRPVWYSLWRVLGALAGGLLPLPLHFANLVAHWGAAWLAGMLAVRWIEVHPAGNRSVMAQGLHRKPGASGAFIALVSTCVFVVFPFARQAVAWPGAVYNPLVSALASGAVILYDLGRRHQRPSMIALAMLLSVIAPFTYEGGLMIAPMLVAVEAVGWFGRRWSERLSAWPLLAVGAAAGTFVIWHAIRGSPIGSFGLHPRDLARNASYLGQGLVYPAAPLGQSLTFASDLPATTALWIIALPTLAVIVVSAARTCPQALLLAIAWFALFALPPLATMEAEWFELAPRFLYTTAGGIALLWAAAAASWYEALITRLGTWRPLRFAIAAVICAILVAPAALYIRRGMFLYRIAGDVIWQAARAGAESPPALFVNLPRSIAPYSRTYPLGFEGITPLPQRVTAEQLVYVNAGIEGGGEAVAFGIVARSAPASYSYDLHGRETGWQEVAAASRHTRIVYLADYGHDGIRLLEAGGPADRSGSLPEPQATFEGRISVGGAAATCNGDGQVRLAATWQTVGPVENDVTIFAHLLDLRRPADGPLAQADGYPLLGMMPFWAFHQGEAVHDVRYFSGVPPGSYQIRIGLWEPSSGRRWATGDRVSANSLLVSVSCP